MTLNLDAFKADILAKLDSMGFVTFHGFRRNPEPQAVAYWDARKADDYEGYLDTARNCGVKMVVFHSTQFRTAMVEDALDRLEECDMPRDEHRAVERRLRALSSYNGFTCALELTYDFQGCAYVYELQAEWYSEFLHTLDELDDYLPDDEDEGGGDEPMGGFLSRN